MGIRQSHVEKQKTGIAEIIIGKQRAGPTGICRVRFFSEYTRFDDLAEREYYGASAAGPADFRDT